MPKTNIGQSKLGHSKQSRDMARRRNRRNRSLEKQDNSDNSSAKAKSKVRKHNKIQKLTQFIEGAQKGMFDMTTELRGLLLKRPAQGNSQQPMRK